VKPSLRLSLTTDPAWWREVEPHPGGGFTVTGGAPGQRSRLGTNLPLSVALRRTCASLWTSGFSLWTAVPMGTWRTWRCVEPDLGEVVLARNGGRWTFTAAGSTATVDPALADLPFPALLKAWVGERADLPPAPVVTRGSSGARTLESVSPIARDGRWELLPMWLDLPRRAHRVGDRWGRADTELSDEVAPATESRDCRGLPGDGESSGGGVGGGAPDPTPAGIGRSSVRSAADAQFEAIRGWVRSSARWLGDPFHVLPDRRFTNAAVGEAEQGMGGPLAEVALPDGRTLQLQGAVPVGAEGLFTARLRVDGHGRRALGEGPCIAVVEALRSIDPWGAPLWTGPSS
jgi:hypothetical protein